MREALQEATEISLQTDTVQRCQSLYDHVLQIHEACEQAIVDCNEELLDSSLEMATSIRLQSEKVGRATFFRQRINRIHEVCTP